jgi:hypothetical protein
MPKAAGAGDRRASSQLKNRRSRRGRIKCPSNCPASFTEQKKLFEYHFFAGAAGKNAYESGMLTIPKSEWNCRRQEAVSG